MGITSQPTIPPMPEAYSVYVLELSKPGPIQIIEERAKEHVGMVPNHVYAAADCWPIYYVGYSSRMPERLNEHIRGGDRAADATKIFPPHALYNTEWYRSRREAQRREEEWAADLRNEYTGSFVYQY